MIVVAYKHGMRASEVCNLRLDDIDMKNGSIVIHRLKGSFPHASDPNQPVPKVNNAHDRAVKDSKVTAFRLYDLRHTWATRAAEAGIDLVTLAAMLGHSKINMVLRYAHPSQEHQTKAMEKMEKFVAHQQIDAAEHTARQRGISGTGIQ